MLELPLDHRRTRRSAYEYEEVPCLISSDVKLRMEHLARQRRSTRSSLYLAAFAMLMSRYSNAREVLIGLPEVAESFATDLSPATFTRIKCRPQRTFARLVRIIEGALAAVRRHDAVPLHILSRLLKLSAQPGRGLVCDVCFVGDENRNQAERTDLFNRRSIEPMSRRFLQLLQEVGRDPKVQCGRQV